MRRNSWNLQLCEVTKRHLSGGFFFLLRRLQKGDEAARATANPLISLFQGGTLQSTPFCRFFRPFFWNARRNVPRNDFH